MGHGKKGGGKKEVLTVGRRGMARLMFTPGQLAATSALRHWDVSPSLMARTIVLDPPGTHWPPRDPRAWGLVPVEDYLPNGPRVCSGREKLTC